MHRAWDRQGVSPVIAVILMVAITIVLAAVVYLTVLNLTPSGQSAQYITFVRDTSSSTSNKTAWRIAGAFLSEPALVSYKAILLVNGTPDNASAFDPLAVAKHGRMAFTSVDDRLTGGDTFEVDVQPGARYQIVVFTKSTGNELQRTDEWTG